MEVRNIDIVDCKGDECKLLKTFLRHFAELGIAIGGMKSVGHGVLKLLPAETRVEVYTVKDLSLILSKSLTLNELLKGG